MAYNIGQESMQCEPLPIGTWIGGRSHPLLLLVAMAMACANDPASGAAVGSSTAELGGEADAATPESPQQPLEVQYYPEENGVARARGTRSWAQFQESTQTQRADHVRRSTPEFRLMHYAKHASLIVYVQVDRIAYRLAGDGPYSVVTDVTLNSKRRLRGSIPSPNVVSVRGGVVDGQRVVDVHAPQFVQGEEYLAFLLRDALGGWSVVAALPVVSDRVTILGKPFNETAVAAILGNGAPL